MNSVFVKKTDRIKVTVYSYEFDNQMQATSDKSDIPDEASDPVASEFIFRRPNHNDSTFIMKSAALKHDGAVDSSSLSQLNDVLLKQLLVGWNITENGESVPFEQSKISSLHPAVARAAAGGLLEITGI